MGRGSGQIKISMKHMKHLILALVVRIKNYATCFAPRLLSSPTPLLGNGAELMALCTSLGRHLSMSGFTHGAGIKVGLLT